MVNFLHVPVSECRNTKPFLEPLGIECPTCKGQIIRRSKRVANFMAVVIIQIVILFPGISLPKNAVQNVEACYFLIGEKGNKLICSKENCSYKTTIGA